MLPKHLSKRLIAQLNAACDELRMPNDAECDECIGWCQDCWDSLRLGDDD